MKGPPGQRGSWRHREDLPNAGLLRSPGQPGRLGLCLALLLWGSALQGAEAMTPPQQHSRASRRLLEEPVAAAEFGRVEEFQDLLKSSEGSGAVNVSRTSGWEGKDVLGEPLLCPEDREAFAKALSTKPSSGSPPRIAFLFLVRGPLPLAALWAKFFEGQPKEHFSIYIHAAVGYKPDEQSIPDVFRGRHIPSQPTKYRTIKILDAERRLLANALQDPRNTHFVLVCQSTAPLFSFPYVYDFLTSERRSFISAGLNSGWHWTEEFLPLIPRADWAYGDAWFALRRRHARMVVEDQEYYSYFKAITLSNGYDEHYCQTLLRKKDPQGIIPRTLMSVRWPIGPNFRETKSTHPLKYESWHITPGLIADLAGSSCTPEHPYRVNVCHLFARKFTPNTLEPLLRLLPLTKPLHPEEWDHLAAQWSGHQLVHLPKSETPWGERPAGLFLEAWKGKIEKVREDKASETGAGPGGGVIAPYLSPEEEGLLGRASAVDPAGAPRVAFLFLVREEFLLAPLWERFFQGQQQGAFSTYVHAGSSDYNTSSLPGVFQPANTIRWKDTSRNVTNIEGARRLLALALEDPLNSHFVLLCEATVPLFNFSFTINYITGTPYSYVDSKPGVEQPLKPNSAANSPGPGWRLGKPWFVLQRAHAVLEASDIPFYRALLQASPADDGRKADAYFSSLMNKQDPGRVINHSLVVSRSPPPGPGQKDPPMHSATFYFWDVGPGLIRDMAAPLCPYVPKAGTGRAVEEISMPCHLFARKLHGDALTALRKVLPAMFSPRGR